MQEIIGLITFGQFLFRFFFSSFAFTSLIFLCYRHSKLNEEIISVPLCINIITWITTAFFDLLYITSSFLSRTYPKVPSDLIFWSGSLYFATTTAVSMSVFFLMLDRITILLSRSNIGLDTRRHLSIANAALVLAQFFVFITIFVVFERPNSTDTECETFSCVATQHASTLNLTRAVYGSVNTIMAIVFAFLIFRYNKRRGSMSQNLSRQTEYSETNGTTAVRNRVNKEKLEGNFVAGIAVGCQIFFNFLPNLGAYTAVRYFQMPISDFGGPVVSTFSQLDALTNTVILLKVVGSRVWSSKITESR
ncbi:hypothetical protein M3Y96_00249500 [Aphelenchoides besseyi]|nr:hypothetical protein M3Y96_00249500 [Aphelenchoides besseyi]